MLFFPTFTVLTLLFESCTFCLRQEDIANKAKCRYALSSIRSNFQAFFCTIHGFLSIFFKLNTDYNIHTSYFITYRMNLCLCKIMDEKIKQVNPDEQHWTSFLTIALTSITIIMFKLIKKFLFKFILDFKFSLFQDYVIGLWLKYNAT